MFFIIHELLHLLGSVIAGITIYFIYAGKMKLSQKKRSLILLLCIMAGLLGDFFIDLDHLIDYFLLFGASFHLDQFIKGTQFALSGKNYVFFHAYEYPIILFIIARFIKQKVFKMCVLAFALGLLLHLIVDVNQNGMIIPAYSIIYRILHNFDLRYMHAPK